MSVQQGQRGAKREKTAHDGGNDGKDELWWHGLPTGTSIRLFGGRNALLPTGRASLGFGRGVAQRY